MEKALSKLLSFTLAMSVIFIASCENESTPPPTPTPTPTPGYEFPNNSVSITKVYDINNNGNATDLRVNFKLSTADVLLNAEEIGIIVSKSSLTIDQVKALSSDRYAVVSKPTDITAIGRITTTITDIEGGAIANDVLYKVYVFLKNAEAYSLSNALDITLKNKPIYAGRYKGIWNDALFKNFKVSMILNDDYTGDIFYSDNFVSCCPTGEKNDAAATFIISGATISSFEANQFLPNYALDGCPTTYTAVGTIPDEITLSLTNLAGTDCDGNHAPGTVVFTRQ